MYKLQQFYYQRSIRRKKLVACLLLATLLDDESESQNRRRVWIKKWVARRKDKGLHHNLFLELSLEDPNQFRICLRMDTTTFVSLLEKLKPLIEKQDTHTMRESIPASERLSVTLRHLATGEKLESLSCTFRLGKSTISGIIKEVVAGIIAVLKEDFLRSLTKEEEWAAIAYDYGERWNFNNCIGAMDGKQCLIDPPLRSGSMYYIYKGTFSVVLLAIVDAQLRFIYIDAGMVVLVIRVYGTNHP